MAQVLETIERASILVHFRPLFAMDDEQFAEFCRLNRDLRIEMTAEGDLIIMPPTGGRTGNRNARLTQQLANWTDADGTGVSFDSSTLFVLPNKAKRSPDVSWISRARLAKLSDEAKEKFMPICPDFVIELRSPSDSLAEIKDKMREYIENGAQLSWLLYPPTRTAFIYRADGTVEEIPDATTLTGENILHDFTLDLTRIWDADF